MCAIALWSSLVTACVATGAAEAGPLNLGLYPSAVGLGVEVGTPMTYGDVISRNDGPGVVIVDDAELLTDGRGATVAEVRILDTDAVPSGTLVGEAHTYDPPSAAMRLPGAVLLPSTTSHQKAYQFIFSITVTAAGGVEFFGLRVRYHASGRTYVTTAAYQLRLCTPRGATCRPSPVPDQ